MNLISVLSCLSLVLAAASAQAPKPCTVPALLSGGITVMTKNILSTGTIGYDAFGKRVRVRNYGVNGNQTFAMEQLMLFNQKVYYEINWSNFSCKKKPLDTSFIPLQVPADAKLMGQVIMGSSSSWGMGVLINTWYGSLPQNGTYSSVFTEIGCIPVVFNSYTPATGWTILSTFNWVVGTVDTMGFIPPFFCAKSKLEETATPDTFFSALESLAMKTKNVK